MGQSCSSCSQFNGDVDARKQQQQEVDNQWYYDLVGTTAGNKNSVCRGQLHLLYNKRTHRSPPQERFILSDATNKTTKGGSRETPSSYEIETVARPTTPQNVTTQAASTDNKGGGDTHLGADGLTVPGTTPTVSNDDDDKPFATKEVTNPIKKLPRTTLVSRKTAPSPLLSPPQSQSSSGTSGDPPTTPASETLGSDQHIYAIRCAGNGKRRDPECAVQEQRPFVKRHGTYPEWTPSCPAFMATLEPGQLYTPQSMSLEPSMNITDWVSVSDELNIYVCDVGLSSLDCDALVAVTEYACRGQYAAYTYAKQTLGCRDYPLVARACWDPVHRVYQAIHERLILPRTRPGEPPRKLQLDDREPHVVKYDVTKKERQKLDMHTDKSEWTFLIALSDGCGLDYEGGGTFFEALDATVHIQRGHAVIFPGKLRHCGIRISQGLRFLLVGFLVDKNNVASANNNKTSAAPQKEDIGTA